MENKVYLLYKSDEFEGSELIKVYLDESLAARECVRCNIDSNRDWHVTYYVETWVVHDT